MGTTYDVHRDVRIPVSYNSSTKSGKLTGLNVDVLVDDLNPDHENVGLAMIINHRCFLNCYVGVGEEDGNGGIMVHQDTCMALKSNLCYRGKSIDTFHLPPATGGRTPYAPSELYSYTYVTNFYRRIFGSIISFIVYLHKRGISIDGELKLDQNFYIKDNEIKFFRLKLVRTDARVEWAEDFKEAAGIIKEIIDYRNLKGLDIPPDMRDLLHIMEDVPNFRKEKESLIGNHLAILSHNDTIARIRNFHSKEVFVEQGDKYKYNTAVQNMVRTGENSGDWTQRFKRKDLKMGPAQSCFDFGGLVEPYIGTAKNKKDKITVNKNLLRFCRNLAEHGSSEIHKMYPKMNITESDVELTVMALFGDELLSFQEEAHKTGVLPSLL